MLPGVTATVGRLHLENLPVLAAITAGLSNLVSNVPAVLVLKPFVANSPDPPRAWLIVAMTSTLTGNLTLLGSVANLIGAQRTRAQNVTIGFWEYLEVGAPLTAFTILFGACGFVPPQTTGTRLLSILGRLLRNNSTSSLHGFGAGPAP